MKIRICPFPLIETMPRLPVEMLGIRMCRVPSILCTDWLRSPPNVYLATILAALHEYEEIIWELDAIAAGTRTRMPLCIVHLWMGPHSQHEPAPQRHNQVLMRC
jgi:hypothetical protein